MQKEGVLSMLTAGGLRPKRTLYKENDAAIRMLCFGDVSA